MSWWINFIYVYIFTNNILESGGTTSPYGGEYIYAPIGEEKVSDNVSRVSTNVKDVINECGSNRPSFVTITIDEENNYQYAICLSTTENAWLAGTEKQVNDFTSKDNDEIFYGIARE